ncbi:MAG: dTMP kinase [Rhodospirillaceae bacterium]|nr:dTMP kinase [Rhodospirillaceae bacterium]
MNEISGRLITFEGGEGTGKSTQAKLLVDALGTAGIAAITTREPGGAPGAEAIRGLLVEGEGDRWDPFTETLLHITARHDHVQKTVRPALESGKWVVSDRFLHSTLAYQGYGLGQELETIDALHDIALAGLAPDLTLILDLDVEAGLARAEARGDGAGTRYEEMGIEFHRRVRAGFLEMAGQAPDRFVVLDGNGDIDTVAAGVVSVVSRHFDLEL